MLTDVPIPDDKKLKENLCVHCKKCLKNCPSGCFTENETGIYDMDKVTCTKFHVQIKNENHWREPVAAPVLMSCLKKTLNFFWNYVMIYTI